MKRTTSSRSGDLEPWERQPHEGMQAFEAFVVYRDQPNRRSTSKVAQELGKSESLIHRWCARWRWVQRARDYDHHLERQARHDREADILAFRRRAARQAREKAEIMTLSDRALIAKLEAPDAREKLDAMPIAELIALSIRSASALPNLLKAEAMALGLRDMAEQMTTPPQDFLSHAIEQDEELFSMAATLIERASNK